MRDVRNADPKIIYSTQSHSNVPSEIQSTLPRTLDIYAFKGFVGRLFKLRPMGLRLIWETGEWDPVGGVDNGDDWGCSDEEEEEKKVSVASASLFSLIDSLKEL